MTVTTRLLEGVAARAGTDVAAGVASRTGRAAADDVAADATDSIMGAVPRALGRDAPGATAPTRALTPVVTRPPPGTIGVDAAAQAQGTRAMSSQLMNRAIEAAQGSLTPKAWDTARNATADYARDTLAHARALMSSRVAPELREGANQEARKLFSEAGAAFAQAARLDRSAVSTFTNDAIAAFVRGGNSNAVAELVQRDYARGVGAVFDIARAAPFAESKTVLRVAREVADAGRRAHGEPALTDRQFTSLFEAHQAGRWRSVDLVALH